jgi:hypothetical protein
MATMEVAIPNKVAMRASACPKGYDLQIVFSVADSDLEQFNGAYSLAFPTFGTAIMTDVIAAKSQRMCRSPVMASP